MTYFNTDDLVEARMTAQGMIKGKRYLIVDVSSTSTPFGEFVAYKITPNPKGPNYTTWGIANAHLLCKKVKETIGSADGDDSCVQKRSRGRELIDPDPERAIRAPE